MSNVSMMNVRGPFWLDYHRERPGARGEWASSANIAINNLTATGLGRTPFVVLANANQPVKSLVLNNVSLNYIGGAQEKDSNEQGMSPFSMLPWYGFYANSVTNLGLHNERLGFQDKDFRPALFRKDIDNLELDGFHAERAEGGDPSVMLEHGAHLMIDRKMPSVAKLRIVALDLNAPRIIVGEPFQTTATVQNSGLEGLGDVQLQLGGETLTRRVWLSAGETAKAPFADLVVNKVGQQQAQAGQYTKNFTVYPKPSGHPVGAPFVAFDNADGQVQELDGGGFYVKAAADPGQCLWRADTYAAAYLKGALERSGFVVTRLQNPDGHAGWFGQVGIMVRNDISQPGKSGGYLVLEASPASGYYMEWATNGLGRVNKHTEMAGYTYWPSRLKLERQGNTYTGYYSKDGATWVKVGEVALPGADGHQDAGVFAHMSTARFTDFKVENQTAQK